MFSQGLLLSNVDKIEAKMKKKYGCLHGILVESD